MNKWAEKLETLVHKLIPWCLLILIFVIISEVFFAEWALRNRLLVKGADYLVIAIFVIDIFFKYQRSQSMKQFVRVSWLDIIAVFPFFLMFRALQEITALFYTGGAAQATLHEVLESGKVGRAARSQKLFREAGFAVRESKLLVRQGGLILRDTGIAARYVRTVARMPRVGVALEFFRHPRDHLHWHKKMIAEQKSAKKSPKKPKRAHKTSKRRKQR